MSAEPARAQTLEHYVSGAPFEPYSSETLTPEQ